MSCSAFGCTKRHSKGSSVNFFRFPLADNDRLKKWLINVRRKDWTPSNNSRLCSTHFAEDQFFKDKEGKRRLKDTAVPTIFVFQTHWLIEDETAVATPTRSVSMTMEVSNSSVSTPEPSCSSHSRLAQPQWRAGPADQPRSGSDSKVLPNTDSTTGLNNVVVKEEPVETDIVNSIPHDDIIKVKVHAAADEVVAPVCTTSRGSQTSMHDHNYRSFKQQKIFVCSDHNYVVSDSPKTLKRKADAARDQLVLAHKKIKIKCQQTRRLKSRLVSLKNLTKGLKKKLKAVEKALAAANK